MSSSLRPHRLQHPRLLCSPLFPEFAQIHWFGDVIKSFHPLLPPFPFAFNLSQHQGFFPMSWLFTSGSQSTGASTSTSILPMNIQGWFLLGLTGMFSLQSKGLSKSLRQYHSSKASILRHSAFFMVQLWHPYMTTRKTIALTIWTFVSKVMSLLFNTPFRFVIAFLPRSKLLWISWL